jgi:biopolymer transport protein ExbB
MWPHRSFHGPPGLTAVLLAGLAAACGFKSPGTGNPDAVIAPPDSDSDPDAADPGADAAVDAAPIAWLTGWTHRKPITLRASQIEAPGNGALTDFPVLVSVTDAQIGARAQGTGADIVFTAADGTTLLASEIEAFTPGANQLVAWVKVPTLSATVDTALYVYYGNPTPPARTSESTWTASYLGVWHLAQDPGAGIAGNILDSTANNQDATARNIQSNELSAAQIGLGLDFDGMNDFLDFPSADLGNSFTISMWVAVATSNNIRTLLANSGNGLNTDGFRFFVNTAGSMDRRLILETGNGNASGTARTNMNAITFGALTHVAVVVNRATNTALLYVNGASAAITTTTAANLTVNSNYNAGRMEDGSYYFAGKLDEIEIATTARPAEWIKTSVNNQSQPTSFHTLGPEEQAP